MSLNTCSCFPYISFCYHVSCF